MHSLAAFDVWGSFDSRTELRHFAAFVTLLESMSC